jgi:hypothetical protein
MQLKLAGREVIARNLLVSVDELRRQLAERGFKTNQGSPLDWYYVANVVRKAPTSFSWRTLANGVLGNAIGILLDHASRILVLAQANKL